MRFRLPRLIAATFSLVAASAPLSAQDSVLTLGAAITRARAAAPLAIAAGGRSAIARGRSAADGAFPNPTLEWRRENDPAPIMPDIFTVVTLPIDVTGRRFAIRAAGRALVSRGVADSATFAQQAAHDASRAWWRAVLAQGLRDVARDQRVAFDGIAAFDRRRFREGAVSELVALRTQLEADRARLAEATSVAELARARAELARAIGADRDVSLRVAVPTRLSARDMPSLDSALELGANARPDVLAARHAVREAEERALAERRGVLGADVQLVGGQKRTQGYNTAVISAIVPLPIFNRNGGARERAAGELTIARADLRDAELRARGDVMSAYDAWQALTLAAPDGSESFASAGTDVATITDAAYREGGASLLELLESQRARAEARAAAIRWLVDSALARLELDRAMGARIQETP